jgi:hypothetical protein
MCLLIVSHSQPEIDISNFLIIFTMDFNDFRLRFSEPDRIITLDQFRALTVDELNALIRDANLSRPDAGQARLFHPSSFHQLGIFIVLLNIVFLAILQHKSSKHAPTQLNLGLK